MPGGMSWWESEDGDSPVPMQPGNKARMVREEDGEGVRMVREEDGKGVRMVREEDGKGVRMTMTIMECG